VRPSPFSFPARPSYDGAKIDGQPVVAIGCLGGAVVIVYKTFMRGFASVVYSLVGLALIALAIAFLVHIVTTDTIALRRLADDAICTGQRAPCRPAYTLLERNALGVTIDYETPFKSIVRCRRPQLVFGEYACAVVQPLVAVAQPPSAAPPPTSSTRVRTRP
jgi:hypothetical protein